MSLPHEDAVAKAKAQLISHLRKRQTQFKLNLARLPSRKFSSLKDLLIQIADHINNQKCDGAVSWPSQDTLAQKIGVSVRWVKRLLKLARRIGCFDIVLVTKDEAKALFQERWGYKLEIEKTDHHKLLYFPIYDHPLWQRNYTAADYEDTIQALIDVQANGGLEATMDSGLEATMDSGLEATQTLGGNQPTEPSEIADNERQHCTSAKHECNASAPGLAKARRLATAAYHTAPRASHASRCERPEMIDPPPGVGQPRLPDDEEECHSQWDDQQRLNAHASNPCHDKASPVQERAQEEQKPARQPTPALEASPVPERAQEDTLPFLLEEECDTQPVDVDLAPAKPWLLRLAKLG